MLRNGNYFWNKEIDVHRFSRQLQETLINKIFSVKLLLDPSRDGEDAQEIIKKLKFTYTVTSI